MLALKEHYRIEGESGWKPWYTLALAIASNFDDGLKIVDFKSAPPAKTQKRWRGVAGLVLLKEVQAALDSGDAKTVVEALGVLKDEMPQKYGHYDLRYLENQFYIARKRHP